MPRGQYNREAARIRREGVGDINANHSLGDAVASPQTAKRARGVDRGDEWNNRSRKIKGHIDYYNLAAGLAPEDAVYQWKAVSVLGQDLRVRLNILAENGWSAVPSARHPYLPSVDNAIIHDGLMLMEQPKWLYDEARQEETQAAQDQLRFGYESVGKTEKGQMDRVVQKHDVQRKTMLVDAHGDEVSH